MMDSPSSAFNIYHDSFLNSSVDYLQFPSNGQFGSPSSPRLSFGSLNLNSATGAPEFSASPYPSPAHSIPMSSMPSFSHQSSGSHAVAAHGGSQHGSSNAGSGADSNGRASPLDGAFTGASNVESPYLQQAFHHQQRLAGGMGISPPLTHMSSVESLHSIPHSQSLPLSHHSHFPMHMQGRMSPSASSGTGSPGPAYTVAPSQSHQGLAAASGAMNAGSSSVDAFSPGSSLPRQAASSLVHRHQRGYSSSGPSVSGGGSRSRSSQRKTRAAAKAESDDDEDMDDADFKMDSKDDKGDKGPGSTERRREEIRKQRIESEQRRRDELRDGYRKLKDVLPTSNQKSSKVSLLDRATTHIKFLDETQKQLTLRLQQAESETHRLRQVNETLMLSAAEHRSGHALPPPPPPPHSGY